MGVPCIGLADMDAQMLLWPGLCLGAADPQAAVALGRHMFTDQGAAAEACAQAQERARLGSAVVIDEPQGGAA
jgi:hypothetical protein